MKKILSYITLLLIAVAPVLTACSDDQDEEGISGLAIRSFMPTSVMENLEMTINGTGFSDVDAVVFPGGVTVTDFELVSSSLIRLNVPADIDPDGGKLVLMAGDDTVESSESMTIAQPAVSGMEPGDEIEPTNTLTINGEDMQCIKEVRFPSQIVGDSITVETMSFLRKSSDNLKLRVPANTLGGMVSFTLVAADGSMLQTDDINVVVSEDAPSNAIVCTIQQVASGKLLSRHLTEIQPRLQDATGSRMQTQYLVPIDGENGYYYIQNAYTKEYLAVIDDLDWAMHWVDDPTTLEEPNKAMFQVTLVEGSESYYTIKNRSSNLLGSDSTDEDSEIFCNKSGQNEPLNQWIINVSSGSLEGTTVDATTIWEGPVTYASDGWISQHLSASLFLTVEAGQSIRIYFTPSTGGEWVQIDLRDGNDEGVVYEWHGLSDYFGDGYIEFEVTEDIAERLKSAGAGGLTIRGYYFTLDRVDIIGGSSTSLSTGVIWEGNTTYGSDGWISQFISVDHFATLAAGQVMRVYFTPSTGGEWVQVDMRDGLDAVVVYEWHGLQDFFNDGYFDISITESVCDQILNAGDGGLTIRGYYFTLTKVELIQAN